MAMATDPYTGEPSNGSSLASLKIRDRIQALYDGVNAYYAFTTVVAGATSLVAEQTSDTLTVAAGTGIQVTGVAGTDTMTITNSGATSIVAGTDITVSGATGAVTVNAAEKVHRLGHTWAVPGEIAVPSGDTDYIVPFFVSLATGQTAALVKARYRINSGTSVTCKLQKNGVDVTGYTGISVTGTTAETDAADVSLADNDLLALVVTAVAGTPKNMTVTVFIEHTQ